MNENNALIRIQKYISDCGLMSRRKAEEEITAGNISINGETAKTGAKIDPDKDIVEYRGKRVCHDKTNRYIYLMLNKPVGYVTTLNDEKGRKCVAELVADVGKRVYPCGRLDLNSEGLLLMTNDGDFANKFMHPKHHIPKIYTVKVNGKITPEQTDAMNKPMNIDGYITQPADVRIIQMKNNETVLGITLYEGRNRQIRKMCENAGLTVNSLRRIAIGDIKLGSLKSGTWKMLTHSQVEYIKNYK